MGKAWGHIGNLLLIGIVIVSKEIAAEANRRKVSVVTSARNELNGLYDVAFGKKPKEASSKSTKGTKK